jgi:hypothetical protein
MTAHTERAHLRAAVIGILSRPGGIEQQADEICAAAARVGKQAAAAEPVQRCQNPDDPHSGTALVGGRCPICLWSPHTAMPGAA